MRNPTLIASLLALTLAIPTFAQRTPALAARAPRTPTATRTPLMGTGRQVPLSEEFSVLDQYSIFDVNRMGVPASTRTERGTQPPAPAAPPSPVFRASLVDDFGPLAVIETPAGQGSRTFYLREGQTVPGTSLKVQEITWESMRLAPVEATDGKSWIDVPIGCNFDGVPKNLLPTAPTYLSADAGGTPAATPAANASVLNGRFPNQTPGATRGLNRGNFGPGLPASGATGALVSPSLDPPLPAGSADDIAARMAARQLGQLNGMAVPQ